VVSLMVHGLLWGGEGLERKWLVGGAEWGCGGGSVTEVPGADGCDDVSKECCLRTFALIPT